MAGFIKINRDIEQSWVWQNYRHTWMWLKLKLLEEFEDGVVRLGKSRKKIAFKKGQKAILLKDLASVLQVSHRALRDFLETLEDEGMISADIQPKYTVITFLDNNESNNQNERKSRHHKDTTQSFPQITHYIEENKERNNKNNFSILSRDEEISIFEKLKQDDAFWKNSTSALNLPLEELKVRFDEFFSYILATEDFHENEADIRRHFINTVRKQKETRGRPKKFNTDYEIKQDARRSTPPPVLRTDQEDSTF